MNTLLDPLEDLPPGIAQYEDYHTIDWQREIARDRMRHRFIVGRWRTGKCFEKLKSAHDAWSGWICVLLVGCVTGEFLVILCRSLAAMAESCKNKDLHVRIGSCGSVV